jgi:toxin-antitoxin system PIN domain toxin
MLLDANLLLYAVDRESPFHASSAAWLTGQLNGDRRVGIPWAVLVAFLRISTNPRAYRRPLTPHQARHQVDSWLARDVVWTPTPTGHHARVLGDLIERYDLRGNLVSDAHLAALAIEHGLTVCSADTDFARFTEVPWNNPLTG